MSGYGDGRQTYAGGVGGGSSGLKIAANTLDPRAIGSKGFRYVYDEFRSVSARALLGGAASGTTSAVNVLETGNLFNMPYEYAIIGAGQTIIVPVLKPPTNTQGAGIDIGLDQTLAEGLEITFGAQQSGIAYGRLAFKVATDRAFFCKATLCIEDVSGSLLYFGWRKAQALTTISAYTDYALIGLTTVADATGVVNVETDNDDAGPVTTDTGKDWADNGTHTMAVVVSAEGVVSYYWDGAKLNTPPAYTFDATDVVIPMLRAVNQTDLAGQVVLQRFEAGFCSPQGS